MICDGRQFTGVFVCVSVPTFTVHPGVARPPSPLMIIHKDIDDDDDEDDDDDDDDEPSVPLEQYRAWLGELLYCSFSQAL